MQDEPTPSELIKAVADFLRNELAPQVSGHHAFKLRVAINALDLVTRQLALEPGSDAAELARLSQLLGMDGSLPELNRALAARLDQRKDAIQPGAAFSRHDAQAVRGGKAMPSAAEWSERPLCIRGIFRSVGSTIIHSEISRASHKKNARL